MAGTELLVVTEALDTERSAWVVWVSVVEVFVQLVVVAVVGRGKAGGSRVDPQPCNARIMLRRILGLAD